VSVAAQQFIQRTDRLSLFIGHVPWNFDAQFKMQITASTSLHRRQASACQTQYLAAFCSCCDPYGGLSIDGRYSEIRAEGGLCERDGDFTVQICPASLEKGVFVDAHDDIEIARFSGRTWVITFASQLQFLACSDPFWNPDPERLDVFRTAGPFAF
jgi:hypothetical protein